MNHSYAENPGSSQSRIALHVMVNQLSATEQVTADSQRHLFINEIPDGIFVNIDEKKLSEVIGSLLNTVLSYTCERQIRISAKAYGKVLLLHIRDSSRLNSPAFAGSLVDIQNMAVEIRGNVSVTSYRNNITTIALSFVNSPVAA